MNTRISSDDAFPAASPSPDRKPIRSRGAIDGSIALWNTAEYSNAAELAISMKPIQAIERPCSFGSAYQRNQLVGAITATKKAIHGLRRPPESAIAPRIGAKIAVAMPLQPLIVAQTTWPRTGSPTTWFVK